MKFYYLSNKKVKGPFSLEELKTFDLTTETYMWTEGMSEWQQIKNLPEYSKVLNIISVPPPIPNDFNNAKIQLPDISISQKNRGRLLKTYRFFALGFFLLLFLIGLLSISVSAKIHDSRLAWYIGLPLSFVSVLSFNYLRKKWRTNKEEKEVTKKKEEYEVDNTAAIVFITLVVALLIITFIKSMS